MRWSVLEFGKMRGWLRFQAFLGVPMATCSGCGERDGGERTRQEALAGRTGASLRGRSVGGDVGHWRTGGVRPGVEWLAAGPGRD